MVCTSCATRRTSLSHYCSYETLLAAGCRYTSTKLLCDISSGCDTCSHQVGLSKTWEFITLSIWKPKLLGLTIRCEFEFYRPWRSGQQRLGPTILPWSDILFELHSWQQLQQIAPERKIWPRLAQNYCGATCIRILELGKKFRVWDKLLCSACCMSLIHACMALTSTYVFTEFVLKNFTERLIEFWRDVYLNIAIPQLILAPRSRIRVCWLLVV